MQPMTHKRMLSALLLAAAFSLGVLVAQVQAGAIFLPLVARAWDGEPMATPVPPATVRVENVHYHALRECFYGVLVNETACTVSASGVTMYLLDADGLPVSNETGYSMAPVLLPGERTPFLIRWYGGLPAWESYVIYPHWHPVDRLTVEGAVLTEREYGGWLVTATVHNQLPVRVQSLAVGAVLYGPSGEVVGYDPPYPWELLGPLAPGDTLVVTRTFSSWVWDASIEPVGCAAFAVPSGGFYLSLMEQGKEAEER